MTEKGEKVFRETCARCHGTYGANPEFPNKVIPNGGHLFPDQELDADEKFQVIEYLKTL